MGPNPNAEFEEDEFGDMSFDEWQEMMEEEEEEAEEDEEDYTEEVSVAYDSEDEGISYLNMTMLPAVGAVVKKTEQAKGFAKLFKSSRSGEAEAVVMAGVVPLSGMLPAEGTYYKQIEQNGDRSYRLHLGVTGGEQQGLDIVLAIDLSNSMNDKIGYSKTTRLEALKDTLGYRKEVEGERWPPSHWEEKNGFIDDLFAQSPNSRFSVVTYSYDSAVELGWTELGNTGSGKTRIKETIGGLKADGGTNYEAGLYKTIETLKERGNSSNIPVVIFLSDGKPTYYYAPVNEFNEAREESGKGSKIDDNTGDGTIFAAGKFHDEMEKMNGSVYTVGFGIPGLSDEYRHYQPEQYLYAISQGLTWDKDWENKLIAPENNDGTTLETDGADAQGLKDAFADILSNLKMENVTISDQLSEFVTFKGNTAGASNVKVQTFKKNQSGELVLQNELQEGRDYESLEFNSETGTIRLIFGKDKKLESGVIYELSFDIQVKDGVEIQPEDKVIGEPNTDYGKGQISSGKPGVGTNTEGYFTFGEDGTTKVYYPHPIIPASAVYTPEHQKYIRDNGDGTYDLTLNVTSTKESSEDTHTESVPADVMFLVDKSRSMVHRLYSDSEGEYKGSRAEVVNNALSAAINTLGGYKDIQLGGYKWSDNPSKFLGWYESTEQANAKLLLDWGEDKWVGGPLGILGYWEYAQGGDIESGGTCPSSALKAAISKLKEDDRENVKKYIIFLTDGEPSYNYEYENSYNAVADLQNLIPGTKLYAVGMTNNTDNTFMETVVRKANGLGKYDSTDGLYINGSNEEKVNAALKQIADEIVNEVTNSTPGVTNVTITDTLSKYAEFAFDTNNLDNVKVTRKTADGTETELQKDEYTVNISGKTITLSLTNVNDASGKTNELEKNVTYSITFQVKPTEEAKQDYQTDNGYYRDPNGNLQQEVFTGAEGTDAPGNTTSSGQPGFPSNEKAVLSWQYDGAAGKIEYDHPVLQVPQTGQFVVQKLVEIDDNETPLADAKFIINLDKADESGNYTEFSSVALKADGTSSPAVKTEGEAQFKISEAVPMEYSLTGIEVFQKAASGELSDVTDTRLQNDILTVQPGDDLIVKVTNNLAHEGYFHSTDQVTNWTNGNPETPFTSDKSAAREAAESQPKADAGKKNKKVTEMEEEEGDPLV